MANIQFECYCNIALDFQKGIFILRFSLIIIGLEYHTSNRFIFLIRSIILNKQLLYLGTIMKTKPFGLVLKTVFQKHLLSIRQFLQFIIIYKIQNVSQMLINNTFTLPKSIRTQQLNLLSKNYGLFSLFDKIQAKKLYSVPQNSIVVNLQNITFGPDRYKITTPSNEDLFYQIIYYSLLYYIFQRKQDKASIAVYQKLIAFVVNNQIDFNYTQVVLTQQEIKVYIIKFLNILASTQHKKKLVMEQLNNLPQIHLIFLDLIKQISQSRQILFDDNVRDIQTNIKKELGLQLNILSYQLMLLGNQYQIQMRYFDDLCQFCIFPDSTQNIHNIKNEFLMVKSAYFKQSDKNQQVENIMKKKSGKIAKKQTITSIQWQGQREVQDENRPETFQLSLNRSQINVFPYATQQNQESFYHFQSIVPAQTQKSSIKQNINLHILTQKEETQRSIIDKKQRLLKASYSVKCLKSEFYKQLINEQTKGTLQQRQITSNKQINRWKPDIKSPLRLSTKSADLSTRVKDAVEKSNLAIKKWKQTKKRY